MVRDLLHRLPVMLLVVRENGFREPVFEDILRWWFGMYGRPENQVYE